MPELPGQLSAFLAPPLACSFSSTEPSKALPTGMAPPGDGKLGKELKLLDGAAARRGAPGKLDAAAPPAAAAGKLLKPAAAPGTAAAAGGCCGDTAPAHSTCAAGKQGV